MNAPLIEGQEGNVKVIADRFRQMADKLELNGLSDFGGAFVVVPPVHSDGGDAIETLILDSQQDPAQFWSILKTKAEIVLSQMADKQRQGQAFRR